MKHSLTQRTSYSVVTSNSILLIKQVGLKLSFKSISEEDLRIGSGREFHPAGPATSNILFPNCNFAILTTKSSFEAELDHRPLSSSRLGTGTVRIQTVAEFWLLHYVETLFI